MKNIPYSRQSINEDDINAVIEVLRSNWLTQGPVVKKFEASVAKYCGAKYAVAVSSGTAALHIACLAAGLGKGDRLWTSPNTFVATANCALYCGAEPDFVDINPHTYNLDINVLEDRLIEARKTGSLPRIVMPVHFAGQSCDMERIYELSKRFKFTIVEDACHAMGGSYKGIKIGSCRFSDMAVFSFHPVKTITTGEGGMVLTNNKELYEKLNLFRSHGITRDPNNFVNSDSFSPTQNSELQTQNYFPSWYYQQINLGMNYRITDIQAALGISQLKRIEQFVARRNELARRYDEALSCLPLMFQRQHHDTYSAFHLYVIRLELERIKKNRREVFDALHNRGVRGNIHYIPVQTQPYYQSLGFRRGQFPEAERYYEEAITLPLYPSMTEDEQDYIIDSLKEILS